MYIIRRGGCPAPHGWWFLFFSYIVVHTVDVLRVEIKHVGQIIDRGYEVGGGWATNSLVASFPLESDIVWPRVS